MRDRGGQIETEREKETNEPHAFRRHESLAQRNALINAALSERKVKQAIECVRLGEDAHRTLDEMPTRGTTHAVRQKQAIKAHFDTVNKSVSDVRKFITDAVAGNVDAKDESLVAMRLNLTVIQKHMTTLNNLSNK